MKMKLRTIALLPLFAMALAACATTRQQGCTDEWLSRLPNLTEDERLALFYGAKGKGCVHEWYFELDKNGVPQIAYQKIKLNEVLNTDLKQLKDLDEVLDPKNESWFKLLQETGFRPYLEAQERALKYRVARLQLVLNHEKFKEFMGEVDSAVGQDHRLGYEVRIFFPEFDPAKETPFRVKHIKEAKRNGKLALIGKTIVFDHEALGRKEQDPEYLSDPNRFTWEKVTSGIEVSLYKIMDASLPGDKNPHYLEATRLSYQLDKDGRILSMQRESKPALYIFVSPSEQLDLVVLDSDREGTLGFGLPDVVEKLAMGIITGKDLYLQHQSLLARLFESDEKQKQRRMPPSPRDQKFQVAEAGTPVDPWEKSPSPQGWNIALEYKGDKKDNFHLEVVLKPNKPDDSSWVKQISHVKRVYHLPGKEWQSVKGEVVEYYRPLPEFSEKNIVEARVDFSNRKRLTVEREGQPSISGVVVPGKNTFIEEHPYRIDYTEGATRWRLEDRDKTGVLMYRMEISRSGNNHYTSEGSESSSSSSFGVPYFQPE